MLVTPAKHVTIRRYIGPLPVPASAARAIAKAIVEDDAYDGPTAATQEPSDTEQAQTSHADDHGRTAEYASSITQQQSPTWDLQTHASGFPFDGSKALEQRSIDQHHAPSHSSSPTAPERPTPLPSRPRAVARDPSSASMLSNASFVSAQSMFRSALSDSETLERGQTIFDPDPSSATDAPRSASRSTSPSKRRLGLLSRKSNQSLTTAATAASASSLRPPISILKSPASGTPFARAYTDVTGALPTEKTVANVRSAENLRVAALRQERRIGSEGSRAPASANSASNHGLLSLPILDLPLDQIEEAIGDPGTFSTRKPILGFDSDSRDSQPSGSARFVQEACPERERRAQNSSSETTIIRKSNEDGSHALGPALKPKASFSSDPEVHASTAGKSTSAMPQHGGLLHPAWEQSGGAAGFNSAPKTLPNGSTSAAEIQPHNGLAQSLVATNISSRNVVGRGLPTKRSLTFTQEPRREPSISSTPLSITGPSLLHRPRAVDHNRELSRQSRMSRASTTGTFNTVGSVATDGTFGASAGAASTLTRKFLAGGSIRRIPKRTDSMQKHSPGTRLGIARTQSVRDPFAFDSTSPTRSHKASSPFAVRRRRPGRSTSSASLYRNLSRRISASGTEASFADSTSSTRVQGVLPGAVGTSAGGTKWVGESFQVGKRFWDILHARRDKLTKSHPCSCGEAQDATSQVAAGIFAAGPTGEASAVDPKQAGGHAAKVKQLKQSPDGVITLLAQEAQDVSDDKASDAQAKAERTSATNLTARTLDATPSRTNTRSERKSVNKEQTRRKLAQEASVASIQTIHPEEAVPMTIEARQGWSEIASRMSSLTGELGAGLRVRSPDPRKGLASERKTPKRKAEEKLGPHAHDFTASTPGQNRMGDSDVRILARSSSLAESDHSSTTSKSVYASRDPSARTNGIALRASRLTSANSPTMSRNDALSHPAPPASVEANNPELVHQLLRRKSDLGERPDLLPDTASDHVVATQPVASPPTPTRELASAQAGRLLEQDPLPLDSTPVDESEDHQGRGGADVPMPTGLLKAIGLSRNLERKKTVKFDTGSTRPALKGRFTTSLFAGKAEEQAASCSDPTGTSPGDSEPRPPEEVLARPQPNVIQTSKTTDAGHPAPGTHKKEEDIITRHSVLKKDRMLVKIAWTPHEDLPNDFDELSARKFPIREDGWREFVVVFRMGKVELWADPSLSNKLIGHGDRLKLHTTIPLSRGTTFVSLYSPIDRIFCLTYQPWKKFSHHHPKRGIHLRRQGTDIVMFDCRAQSVAADWMWELWRELGGLIPESLEVHVPSFGLKIKIPVPAAMPLKRPTHEHMSPSHVSSEKGGLFALSSIAQSQDGGEGFKLINRDNIIAMTWKLFSSIEHWRDLVALSQKRGLRLELAWRRGTELDWVINETTVENEPRHWAVLCGALLRGEKHPAILELRAAAHYPTSVLTAPNHYMHEPPAIEGFLWRLKPVSGALTRIYLTSYDGHLYVCRTSRAFPPDRHLAAQMQEAMDMRVPRTSGATQGRAAKTPTPGTRNALLRALAKFVGAGKAARRDEDIATLRQNVLEAISYPAETEEEFQGQIDAYQSFEKRRQFEQIRGSDGFIDLKLIHTVKTVGSGPVRCPGEDNISRPSQGGSARLGKLQADAATAQRDDEESDGEDEDYAMKDIGGQEGLELAEDANDVRRARQIEITLTNGKVFRLEAFSAPVAREWVVRLSDLVKYWRRRERADAVELMYASGIDMGELHKHLQGHKTRTDGFEGVDEQMLSPLLGNVWNWCAIEGCRNIIKSGRLFHKKSNYGAFKARDYVLIAGRLLCFKLVRSVRTARARQNNGIFHRRQDTVIHLRDAYVYSGKLSEDMLQNGHSAPAQAVSGVGGGGSNSGTRHRVPRVYADGMFSVDDDEDCTFVIRYRPERVNIPADPSVCCPASKGSKSEPRGLTTTTADRLNAKEAASCVPTLDDKTHKFIAMRARSKIERDLWVRCVTYEIEKIVREDVERERKLKNTGRID